MPMRGISQFSIKNLLSHSTEKLRGEHFCVSQNFWYRKNLWIKRGRRMGRKEGISRFSVKNFSSHRADIIRRGTILCCVSENFG